MSAEQQTGGLQIEWRVVAATAALVALIGGLTVATAKPHEVPPPAPIPQELIDKCAGHFLPGLCVEIERVKSDAGK